MVCNKFCEIQNIQELVMCFFFTNIDFITYKIDVKILRIYHLSK